jgi:ABC-type multidrug transport system fused ATPase/permease subunit
VSNHIKTSRTTAIVGTSGAGKSTLVDLVARLYDPSSGMITVDDVDLREYDLSSWLAKIGFVSQDTFIFHGTIRDNIAFSKPDASLQEIHAAARQANAHSFIERFAEGYETIVGDRGLKLSGGERQRIAIARALLRDPEILIFDEATSALDNQSEASIQEAIAAIARDRTVIVIAHRLSTIVRAETIIVLDGGKVVGVGTHAALLAENTVYSTLYKRDST